MTSNWPVTTENAQLALDAILGKPTKGIPIWLINPMEHRIIDRLAGEQEGTYRRDPIPTYRKMLLNSGCSMVDQWIPENPLSMGDEGYQSDTPRRATTGAHEIVIDGIRIDSPEAVVRHMEAGFARTREAIAAFDEAAAAAAMIERERAVQAVIGPGMLKVPYASVGFPYLAYSQYGYENYFMAYALYPEVMERGFSLAADMCVLRNRAAVRAWREGGMPPLTRLDHDMADSRGTLVNVKSLDRIWFPHFARSIEPVAKAGIRMIWHCDGNLMAMVPRLLEAGLHGFQGFQYEDGMDYEAICRMKTRDGGPLTIIGGVSVTRTLPHGKPHDVRRELKWLVDNGPKAGLFLGGSSSIAPGVPWENIQALVEGFRHYRRHGRDSG